MILVYKGDFYPDSKAACKAAGISHKRLDNIIDSLWMGGCEACWRLLNDDHSAEDLKQARLDTLDEAEYLLHQEKLRRNEAIAYHLSHVNIERVAWDKVMEDLQALYKLRDTIQ